MRPARGIQQKSVTGLADLANGFANNEPGQPPLGLDQVLLTNRIRCSGCLVSGVSVSGRQLAERVMLGRVVRIDEEQELLIVRVEKGLSAQGGRMWPDSQTGPELVDVGLVD